MYEGEIVSIPKWVINVDLEKMTRESIYGQFRGFKEKDGYDGVMVVLWNTPGYMSEDFFVRCGYVLEAARELGMKIIIWDENGFPSGSCGGEIENNHFEMCAKRIDMVELPADCEAAVVTDDLDCAVLLFESGETRDVTGRISDKKIILTEDEQKNCRLLLFYIKIADATNTFSGKRRLFDYLDPAATDLFLDLTHARYYGRFSEYFGNTVTHAFYDEPAFWHVEDGRIWTHGFRREFEDFYGFDPALFYPALFLDYPGAAAARRLLLCFRADMYARNYVGRMRERCASYGIKLTGHMDQEEIPSPLHISGDLIKSLGAQDMPGVDEIAFFGRGSKAYKLASSSAAQNGKKRVMCEVFGAMGEDMSTQTMLREALELTVKGVNFFVPHGTWFSNNPDDICFPPELSFRSAKFAAPLREFNDYIKNFYAETAKMRSAPRTAILYPVDDLAAYAVFSGKNAYLGGEMPEYSNYLEIGESLFRAAHTDFIFLHPDFAKALPEIANEAAFCRIDTLIIPAMKYIDCGVFDEIIRFFKSGGRVIFAGRTPDTALHITETSDITNVVADMLKNGAVFAMSPASAAEKAANRDINIECGVPVMCSRLYGSREYLYLVNITGKCAQVKVHASGSIECEKILTGAIVCESENDSIKLYMPDMSAVLLGIGIPL